MKECASERGALLPPLLPPPPAFSLSFSSLSLKRNSTCQLGDVVEARVRGRVDDAQPAQEADALRLVGGLGRAAVLPSPSAGGRVDDRCGALAVGGGASTVLLAAKGGLFWSCSFGYDAERESRVRERKEGWKNIKKRRKMSGREGDFLHRQHRPETMSPNHLTLGQEKQTPPISATQGITAGRNPCRNGQRKGRTGVARGARCERGTAI